MIVIEDLIGVLEPFKKCISVEQVTMDMFKGDVEDAFYTGYNAGRKQLAEDLIDLYNRRVRGEV